jgi:RHS repeat-associated protein
VHARGAAPAARPAKTSSTAALTDGSGNVANTYSYEPYGTLVTSTGTVANPWRYTGATNGYFDVSNGLYKIGLRFYDPQLGRWTQRDVVDDPFDSPGWNRYVYAGADPANSTDPSGLRRTGSCDLQEMPGASGGFQWMATCTMPWRRCCYFRPHGLGARVGGATLVIMGVGMAVAALAEIGECVEAAAASGGFTAIGMVGVCAHVVAGAVFRSGMMIGAGTYLLIYGPPKR